MKSLLVPELAHDMIFEYMKERGVEIYSIRFDPYEFEKYHKIISDILLRGLQAVKEFEEFDRYNDKIAKEAGE